MVHGSHESPRIWAVHCIKQTLPRCTWRFNYPSPGCRLKRQSTPRVEGAAHGSGVPQARTSVPGHGRADRHHDRLRLEWHPAVFPRRSGRRRRLARRLRPRRPVGRHGVRPPLQGSVFGLALSVTREHTLAEDVAQEAFLRAWKAAATYDAGRASVSTWLLRITRLPRSRTRTLMAMTGSGLGIDLSTGSGV